MDTAALIAEIKKIPPVTRFLSLSTLAVTLPVMVQLLSIYKVVYHYPLVFHKAEIWRIWTAFFYGGSGLNFLFDLVMLYRTSDGLETQHYVHRSADYAWQLTMACLSLMVLNQPLGSHFFHRQLLITLTYISSRLSPDALFSLFGLVTIQAKWWPYVMVVIDGMMGGLPALAQAVTGLITGHAWYLLFWRDAPARQSPLGRAPQWLKNLITSPPLPAGASGPQPPGFGGRAQPPQPAPARAGYNWGAGHRLGD